MKRIMIGTAFFAISIFVIGCQENTAPIVPDEATTQGPLVKISAHNPSGTIELSGQLSLGSTEGFDNTYNVSGSIQFLLVATDQGPYSFTVVTNATLSPLNEKGETGTVSNESNDLVIVPDKDYVLYKKIMRVDNFGNKEADLNLILAITETDVKVESMWLSQPTPSLNRAY